MAKSDINTTTVSRDERKFYLEDGSTLNILVMLDADGNAARPDDAVIGIYSLSDGEFRGVDLRLFRDDADSDSEPVARPTSDDIRCDGVNRRGKFFRLDNGGRLNFSVMLDGDLRVTNEPDHAVVALFELPDGLFRGVDLRVFDQDMQEITH